MEDSRNGRVAFALVNFKTGRAGAIVSATLRDFNCDLLATALGRCKAEMRVEQGATPVSRRFGDLNRSKSGPTWPIL
jgi:hypothetical protein